jgi:Kef-type K+ transport system membrane component KefB
VGAIIADVIGDIALVFVVASLLGALARKFEQPTVIGQILTGVILGPTLLGRLPGHLTSHLFPSHALPYLNVLSQVAVVVFMFAVGYEIEFGTGHSDRFSLPAMALLIVYFTVVMLVTVRPAVSWWTNRTQSVLSSPVPVAFALAIASAWMTGRPVRARSLACSWPA